MPVTIHPTAIVNDAARLGEDVRIGPFCTVGPDAVLGDRVTLHSHVVIEGHTTLGADSEVYPFAVLGCSPQHTRFAGEASTLEIGHDCVLREHVTMHPGTAIDSMRTIVGNHGLFLVASHVAHDCIVGDHAIFANNASLGGHVPAADSVGIPFGSAVGNRACLTGINVIGLGRRGFSEESITTLRSLYRALFRGDGVFSERLKSARAAFAGNDEAAQIFEFLESAGRNGVCQAAQRHGA